jgi:ribosomal protein L44E
MPQHPFILGETYLENPLARAVTCGYVDWAKELITVTLPERCKKYDEKRGGNGHYLYHGVNHQFCNRCEMHNAWTLNYLGDKNRSELYADLREWKKSYRPLGSCEQKRWEKEEAKVAREKLLERDGTFDYYPSCGFAPLLMCIINGKHNRVEMAEMLLDLGAIVPQLYEAGGYGVCDPRRKQISNLDKDTLLSMLREDKSGKEIKRHLYQEMIIKNAVQAKGYSMEHNSAPLSTILKDILPEMVRNDEVYDEELFHFD